MSALDVAFTSSSRWRRVGPVTASISIAALGLTLLVTPAHAAAGADPGAAPHLVPAADEPLSAPDVVSAAAIARLENRPVEVLGERTETGSTFALPDGTMASGQGSGPVWVRLGGDGTAVEDWAPVDLTLQVAEDGSIRPVAQTAGLVLSGGTVDVMPDQDPAPDPSAPTTDAPAPGPEVPPSPAPAPDEDLEPPLPAPTDQPTDDAEVEPTEPTEPSKSQTEAATVEPSHETLGSSDVRGTSAPHDSVMEGNAVSLTSAAADIAQDPPSGALVEVASVTDPATGAVSRVNWAGDLPTPRLEGRRAVYENVRPGVDLVLEATSTGFAQFIVLNELQPGTDPLSFPLTVATDGADLAVSPDGAISVTDANGAVVANAPVPFMWDAESDAGRAFPLTQPRLSEAADAPRLSPMPDYVGGGLAAVTAPAQTVGDLAVDPLEDSVEVERVVTDVVDGNASVELVPDVGFLQDPETVYPVVIDPDININMGWDTYAQSGTTYNLSEEAELRIGTYNGGATVARSFVHFNTAPFAGKHVHSAQMELFNFYSFSCEARNSQIYNVSPSSAATRWTNLGVWDRHWSTSSDTHGYSAACGGGWTDYDITSLAQTWSSTNTTEGYVGVKAENESDSYGWKRFYSSNNGSYIPSIWVRYNQTPNVPTGLRVSDTVVATAQGSWTRTATPTLSATISDADGGLVHGMFEIADSAQKVIHTQNVLYLTSGSVASIKVPAGLLKERGVYYFRVRVSDDIIEGPRSGWFNFGVDTQAPLAPILTSNDYPNDNTWHKGENQAGIFDFRPAAADPTLVKYRWALDKPPDPAQELTAFTTVKSSGLSITPKTAGRHVLQVQAVDSAGNVSPVVKYAFNVGRAGILTPDDGARVVSKARLEVTGEALFTHVKFQWRRGPDAPAADIRDVPAANLWSSSGVSWVGLTPYGVLPKGSTASTTWDAGATLGHTGGPVQVRAVVATDAAGANKYETAWITLTVDRDATGAASTEVGPGSVNLLTGDHTLSVTDAEEFGMSLVRTASSRDSDSGYEKQLDKLTLTQQQGSALTGLTNEQGVATVATNQFHTGTTSLKVVPPAAPVTTDTYVSVGGDSGAKRLGMEAGRTYRVSAWVFVPASTGLTPGHVRGLSLNLFSRVGTGAYVEKRTPLPTMTNAWQQVSMDVTVPPGSTEIFLRMYNGFAQGSGKPVYFDDISVRELWAPFGEEWSAGTADASSGTAYTRISRPYTEVVAVELTGGGQVWFSSGDGVTWWPEPGAEDLALTPVSATVWRLTEIDGTTTDFVQNAGTKDFPVSITTVPAASGAARHVYDVSVVGQSRLSRIIAPIEDGVDGWPANRNACNPATGVAPARGCEVMDLSYATATTATSAALGRVVGQVDSVGVWGTDPATGVVSKVDVSRYLYDGNGRLTKTWDPRIGTSSATAPGAGALVTSYTYDSTGRLTSAAGSGDEPYRFTYGKAGATRTGAGDFIDASAGRLLKVSRRSLIPGTLDQWGPDNVTTIVYSVPLTRALGGPYNLDSTALATWAQVDGPTDATAVFGPQDVPAVTSATASSPGADGYRPAEIHYLNAAGREVNTASPAGESTPAEGFIDTAEHDRYGNTVRSLDATNRLLALGKLPESEELASWGLGGSGSAYLSQVLDTRSTYTLDGLDVVATRGPAQQLAVANDPDTVAALHSVTRYVYDQGKPDGQTYHLPTTVTSGGLAVGADLVSGVLVDPLVTVNGYAPVDGASATGPTSGWQHKQATSVTVDAGTATALTSTVVYDNRARTVKSSKPGSTGADAGTTLATYFTAGANAADAACGNKPEWAGQPCSTRAAGAVTGHDPTRMSNQLPVKRVTAYNRWGTATVTTDSVTGPVAGTTVSQTRTATTTLDGADRVTSVEITGSGTGAGNAIDKTVSSYDALSGEVATISQVGPAGEVRSEIAKTYDKLGRLITYTDGVGGSTTTVYGRYGEPLTATDSVTDPFGARTVGMVSYTYDRAKDARGFVTSFTDSVGGTFQATWGPDGQLESQVMPGGVTLRIGYDPARVPVSRTYSRTADDVLIASDSVVENHRGQWVRHSSDTGVKDYGYDRLGRLTSVEDRAGIEGVCTSRSYGYDTHTNRTQFATATGIEGAVCPEAVLAPSATYDSADRLVTSATGGGQWSYDPLGRVVSMPSIEDGGAPVENGFYVNDLVASQTIVGASKVAWGLDAIQRRSTFTSSAWINEAWADSVTTMSHYDSDSDEPSWIAEDVTLPDSVTRYVSGVEGDVAMTTSLAGDRELQLVDLHGDIVATVPVIDGELVANWEGLRFTSFDEFGVAKPMNGAGGINGPPARYGWLGAAQRSAEALNGVILMGVRLYSPESGRFLSVDSVAGGSASAYDYCSADPVNCTDLAGTWSWKGLAKGVAKVGELASNIPGPIGAASGAVSSIAYAATGNKRKALEMGLTAAAALVGAGPAVRAGFKVASTAAKAGQRLSSRALPKFARGGACGVGNSFTPDTMVRMADGTVRRIGDVGVGDIVLSGDPLTAETDARTVISPIVGIGERHLVEIYLDGASVPVTSTANHPMWVAGRGWVEAAELVPGDVLGSNGSHGYAIKVYEVRDLGDVDDQVVQNLSVSGWHTYYVATDRGDVLVHNCPAPSMKAQIRRANLPTRGPIRFVPKKGQRVLQAMSGTRNYRDRFGNIWQPGPSRTKGEHFEWDVQLGRAATKGLRALSRDGKHANVSLRGWVTHR